MSISGSLVKIDRQKESLAIKMAGINSYLLPQDTKMLLCCSVHTWNDNLRDSLPHLNAVVTPETCSVYVAFLSWLELQLKCIVASSLNMSQVCALEECKCYLVTFWGLKRDRAVTFNIIVWTNVSKYWICALPYKCSQDVSSELCSSTV